LDCIEAYFLIGNIAVNGFGNLMYNVFTENVHLVTRLVYFICF